jgi:hypothetical protein
VLKLNFSDPLKELIIFPTLPSSTIINQHARDWH